MTRSATQEVPFLSFFLSLDFFVPNHCRCKSYSYNLPHTRARARAVELLWTRDRSVEETST